MKFGKENEKSCGCIIIENEKILLVHQKVGHWGFPKGHVEKDETEEQTAIREVKEETNLDVEIISKKKYEENYITDKGKNKKVIYFLAKRIGGEIKNQESEISEVKWVDFEDAEKLITYKNSKKLLKKAVENIKKLSK